MPTVPADRLTALARRVFAAAGSAEDEAALVAEHLVEANLKGHDSHGVGMIPSYLRNLRAGHAAVNQPGRVVSDQGSIIVYDGERGWGQIVARNAILLGIERARRDGVAVVALRNAHHIGRIGTYGEMCAGAGLVSMHFVNITDQRPAVAPWRGRDGRFGTNPVCVALPGPEPSAADHRRHGDQPHRDGEGAGRAQQGPADRRRDPARPGRRADDRSRMSCTAGRAARC